MFLGSGSQDTTTTADADKGALMPEIHKIERTRYIPSTAAANLGRKKPKRCRLVQSSKVTSKVTFNSDFQSPLPPLRTAVELPLAPKPDAAPLSPKPKSGINLLLLPFEIHEKILEYLPYQEHFTLAQVCDIWMELLQTDKFAVKRYRTLRQGQTAVLRKWCEPTLSERYQRATTNFLLYNQKLFVEMYRDEATTATLIIADKAETRVLSREERVLNKRRDQVANICQVLADNHKYVEIHNLALFERDTMFFVGQNHQKDTSSRGGQGVYFSTKRINIHDYSRIRDKPGVDPIMVPDVLCSADSTLKQLMEGINKHVKKHVLDKYEHVCGCVAFFSCYSKGGAADIPGIVIILLVFMVEPQDEHLYVKNDAGFYTAQLKDSSAAESFNFGFSDCHVPFRAPKMTTKKAMSKISGQDKPEDSATNEPFGAVLGDMENLFISS
ncbi:hypothetical protein TWF481_007702 [Arthrobotrys musiformis]|uniref:F-box domain-containing protein n=1 Tax=Arthrobotrys musiformis TaxID=47236 RepID=A0AAV9WE22_9PEZI